MRCGDVLEKVKIWTDSAIQPFNHSTWEDSKVRNFPGKTTEPWPWKDAVGGNLKRSLYLVLEVLNLCMYLQ